MKSTAASETLVINVGLISGLEKDSNSALHVPAYVGLGIVGIVGYGEGLEDWRRPAPNLDLRASSTADSSLKELQVIVLPERHRVLRAVGQRVLGTRSGIQAYRPHARRHVAAPIDHAREQAGHVLQSQRGGAGHRQSQ